MSHSVNKTVKHLQSVVSCYQANHGESCASYMRREELTTQNLAHKATCLLDKAQSGCLNLNCDGTTLSRKLQGAAISGMILSVNEIPDGSADSTIADISQQLQKLREISHTLQLPHADKINWTLIQSSSSDSASTQKRFHKVVEEKIFSEDETDKCPSLASEQLQ